MLYFKNQASLMFKNTSEGRAAYPYGIMSRGYLVDAEAELDITKFVTSWLTCASLIVVLQIALQVFIGFFRTIELLGAPYAFVFLYYFIVMRRKTGSLTPCSVQQTSRDILTAQAQTYSKARIIFLLIAGVLMTAASLFVFVDTLNKPNSNTVVGAAGVLFFGFGLVQFVRIARAARW